MPLGPPIPTNARHECAYVICASRRTRICVGCGTRVRAPSAEGRILEHGGPADERREDAGIADRAGVGGEQVAVDDREVGQLADGDRAAVVVEVVDVGRAHREAVDRLLERNPFGRQEGCRVVDQRVPDQAVDGDLDLDERVGGRDRPVGAHREARARPQQ